MPAISNPMLSGTCRVMYARSWIQPRRDELPELPGDPRDAIAAPQMRLIVRNVEKTSGISSLWSCVGRPYFASVSVAGLQNQG
jgi:hypothetical protein